MASSHAAVLTNVITASAGDPFLGDWKISTSGATLFGDFSETGALIATRATLGIGHSWFPVDEGTAFTPSYAAMATPFASNTGIDSSNLISPNFGESFYLGVELGDDFEPASRRIGWVELEYSGVELRAIASATEDSGRGLLVGTQTVVPEPSSASLAMLALVGISARRRRFS